MFNCIAMCGIIFIVRGDKMSNEILLLVSLVLYFSTLVILFKYFGKLGLYLWIILASIFANIEVLLQVSAFGLDMTLGNVMFASSFLATDILSERYGKEASTIGMRLGVATIIVYIVFTNFWLLFTPNEYDFAYESMNTLFKPIPRIAIAGVVVYYICQKIDIFLYHFIWSKTEAKTSSHQRFLWLRNNGSTLVTQLVNNFLFVYLAFATINLGPIHIEGIISEPSVLFSIFLTGWIIMSVIALCDTPIIYFCRNLKVNEYID